MELTPENRSLWENQRECHFTTTNPTQSTLELNAYPRPTFKKIKYVVYCGIL